MQTIRVVHLFAEILLLHKVRIRLRNDLSECRRIEVFPVAGPVAHDFHNLHHSGIAVVRTDNGPAQSQPSVFFRGVGDSRNDARWVRVRASYWPTEDSRQDEGFVRAYFSILDVRDSERAPLVPNDGAFERDLVYEIE